MVSVIYLNDIFYLDVGEEEKELDAYITEDREVESQRTRKTAQQIQTAIMENLRQEFGAAASLPKGAAKDLILHVFTM